MALLNDPKEVQLPCQTKPVDFQRRGPRNRISEPLNRHRWMTGVVFKRHGSMRVAMALPVCTEPSPAGERSKQLRLLAQMAFMLGIGKLMIKAQKVQKSVRQEFEDFGPQRMATLCSLTLGRLD